MCDCEDHDDREIGPVQGPSTILLDQDDWARVLARWPYMRDMIVRNMSSFH